jgi:D-alanine-D-alanine ligase-like ATP-grasp enzyme
MPLPRLILIHEPERACIARLQAGGMAAEHAVEIASYLGQSTDLARRFAEVEAACAARGLRFLPVELDQAAPVLASADPGCDVVWTLTDGIAYFRGGAAPALARLYGLPTIGSDDTLFALCQDKFRSGAVLAALGLPVPPAGLARGGAWIVPPPPAPQGWFVKPNRLGAKIGIWSGSHCTDPAAALDLSRRIQAAYGDDAIVQAYVPGRNARASFLDLGGRGDAGDLGLSFVDSSGDFQTMADSIALYGEAGAAHRAAGTYREPGLVPVAAFQPRADARVRALAAALMQGLGLRDVFSIDLRIEPDDTVHLIEFEICPGLPCFDFEGYCRDHWSMTLAEAMASMAARRLGLSA